MTEGHAGIEREERADNDNRARKSPPKAPKRPVEPEKPGMRERWNLVGISKTATFWLMLGAIVVTMVVGFSFGGWVTNGAAQKTADTAAQAAVTARLAPICVAQFNMDPQKEAKLVELENASTYRRGEYVRDQGWATMPGETAPENRVADACAKLLLK